MNEDIQATICNNDNKQIVLNGRILWEDNDSFGFEINFHETPATMVCYYDVWTIIRKYYT